MTTVCYKDGVIAADSKMCAGSTHAGTARKVFCQEDGSIVVGSGAYQHIVAFVDWVKSGRSADAKPKISDNFVGAHVTNDGVTWFDTELVGYTFEPHRGIWAFGSGEEYAMGAMAHGASAEEACRIACEFDNGSGLPIQTARISHPNGVQEVGLAQEQSSHGNQQCDDRSDERGLSPTVRMMRFGGGPFSSIRRGPSGIFG